MKKICTQCKQKHDSNAMVQFGDLWVCSHCKEDYLQRLKEGVGNTSVSAGVFRIRATCPECGERVSSGRNTRTCKHCNVELDAHRPALYPLWVILYLIFLVLPLTVIAVLLFSGALSFIQGRLGLGREALWIGGLGSMLMMFVFPSALFSAGIRLTDPYITKLKLKSENTEEREQDH